MAMIFFLADGVIPVAEPGKSVSQVNLHQYVYLADGAIP